MIITDDISVDPVQFMPGSATPRQVGSPLTCAGPVTEYSVAPKCARASDELTCRRACHVIFLGLENGRLLALDLRVR